MTYREQTRRLIEFLNSDEDETAADVEAALREAGYDPDAMMKRIRARMKLAMALSPFNKQPRSNDEGDNFNE